MHWRGQFYQKFQWSFFKFITSVGYFVISIINVTSLGISISESQVVIAQLKVPRDLQLMKMLWHPLAERFVRHQSYPVNLGSSSSVTTASWFAKEILFLWKKFTIVSMDTEFQEYHCIPFKIAIVGRALFLSLNFWFFFELYYYDI